jgi:hypothetical protein
VLAAIRDATGMALTRAPVRPEDIALAGAAPLSVASGQPR